MNEVRASLALGDLANESRRQAHGSLNVSRRVSVTQTDSVAVAHEEIGE
jgi:hypothetical protein